MLIRIVMVASIPNLFLSDITLFELLGLIATVVFGILGIWVTIWIYKRKKRPCEILFLAIDCINVYSKLSLGFDSLEIQAKGQKVDNDLLFFSGVFVCNGHADIKGNNHKIRIELPTNCIWNDLKISSKSRDLLATININQANLSQARLCFGQFRMEEFITIKGLIECNNQDILENLDSFHSKIKFHHRIEDTEGVKIGLAIRRQIKLWVHLLRQLPFVLMIVLSILTMSLGVNKSPLTYMEKDTQTLYYAQVNDRGNVILREKSSISDFLGKTKKIVSPRYFKEKYVLLAQYEKYGFANVLTFIMFGSMVLFMVVFLYLRNKHYFRDRRLLRMYVGEKF